MRPFDFATKFRDATFCVATHGDGEAAWLVRGWDALVREYATHCINFDPTSDDIAEAATTLTETEEWQWSAEHPSAPYSLNFGFEDGAIHIYRLASSPAPSEATAAESVTLRALKQAQCWLYDDDGSPVADEETRQLVKDAIAALTAAGRAATPSEHHLATVPTLLRLPLSGRWSPVSAIEARLVGEAHPEGAWKENRYVVDGEPILIADHPNFPPHYLVRHSSQGAPGDAG